MITNKLRYLLMTIARQLVSQGLSIHIMFYRF